MATILGIESTAHTFGVAVVSGGKTLSNCRKSYTTDKGGIIPVEAAKHHAQNKSEIYSEALNMSGIKEEDIDAVAVSQGPGLAPCLLEGMKFAKELTDRLGKLIVPVNHCVAHLEIGRVTGAKDPVMLYASGANTQIIAYEAGKYRIFGETLDIGVGNFIDTFARYAGIGFPGGPTIQKLAEKGKKYIELPYSVKGMDIALSGILTNLKQKLEKIDKSAITPIPNPARNGYSKFALHKVARPHQEKPVNNNKKSRAKSEQADYTLEDLAYSLQETVFAMLVETAERALAHTGKNELLLGGGVACNARLQEMCKIMCKERGAKFFCPEPQFLVDNAAMIAYLGEIMFKMKTFEKFSIKPEHLDKLDIMPRQRTDDVDVSWR